MEKIVVLTLGGIAIVAALIGFALLSAIPVWLLWNAVIPSIFNLPAITFLQALQLSLLCSLLFKSWPSSSGSK